MRINLKIWLYFLVGANVFTYPLIYPCFKETASYDEYKMGLKLMLVVVPIIVTVFTILFDAAEKSREKQELRWIAAKDNILKSALAAYVQDDGRVVAFLEDRIRIFDCKRFIKQDITYQNAEFITDTIRKIRNQS